MDHPKTEIAREYIAAKREYDRTAPSYKTHYAAYDSACRRFLKVGKALRKASGNR